MPDRPSSSLSAARRLLQFARAHWRMALLQFVLAVFGTSLIIVFPGVVQWFVDDIIPSKDIAGIWKAGGLAVGAFFLREFLFYVRTRVNSVFEQRMIFDLRGQLHRKIARLPLSWFDRQSTGDILTRMADDVPATQRVILEGIEQGLTSILQIIISAVVMFYTNSAFALIVMIPTPFIAAGGWLFARWVAPRAKLAREASSHMNSLLHDTITGIRQIKSYTAEDTKQEDFNEASHRLRQSQQRLMTAWAVYSPLMGFFGSFGLVMLLSLGAYGTIQGEITTGELFKFIFLLGFFFEPIARLHGVNQTLVTGLASAERVFKILDQEGEEDLERGQALIRAQGAIEFQDIGFGYQPEKPVLQHLHLTVHPRQTIAIVGATGSGKSTLFQLLTRFYDPQSGSITLDGKDITAYSRISLRDSIAYVTQDAFLFAGTIRENLRLGKHDATEEELWLALRHACAEEFVRQHPNGLDAQVGERGVMLSGGERQRIAMARAFLKDAPILLLDEATSAVDNRSEQLIQQALETLRQDRTCLVIAHRLSTVVSADVIYVMRQGEVLAHGRHEELLESCAYYRELASLALL
ncbi:ATP-binding cassette, subfamily B [Prosthecobacter debontii]|uniref:ATP-binding cassette, subfamily B n=1 Tax=Prosthecobacter debontii TaxID=48467 RepID=A0A1T4WEF8_9BACT|nr:ABC transporter ATP-binding protein [Prosthecobacter debontii]SKA75712.1 ATP-binding cassette, subfamily B [Prosthecobacter debontii]